MFINGFICKHLFALKKILKPNTLRAQSSLTRSLSVFATKLLIIAVLICQRTTSFKAMPKTLNFFHKISKQ